ncbi:GSCFA domain-containing protein [Pseudoroseomonas ludipueritiae]|uniref:GSCFA domain-containing protein n=1 Tax=Pseudoroseomonas ludipueritiae TaxID=198093 RepID=A0ABR7RDR9_9PROT|nr:GSCFA domain-containing protein [Pseudoroseomonas ludipueritiae]MBC9179580.1 GSCFA domain-containing protein [Pseudoroseomonas ludipueritiae]
MPELDSQFTAEITMDQNVVPVTSHSIDTIRKSAEDALAVAKNNPDRYWSSGPKSARERLSSGDYMSINHRPKFKLERTDPVFTIGSCFAREIEKFLIRDGMPVLLRGHGLPAERFETWNEEKQTGGGVNAGEISRGVFHKYTTHSMYFDVDRALNGTSYPDHGMLELAPNRWFDPHSAGVGVVDYETALDNRRRIDAGMQEIKRAKVVLMTLGLTESWIELRNGLVANRVPPGNFLVRRKDLFSFADFGYEDVLSELVKLIELVHDRIPDVKIVCTVSPVPSGTFKARDVVEAYCGSKSTLRTAAETVSRRYDFVDYFPSYEMVTNSPRPLTWMEDGVHVRPDMVKRVTSTFLQAYYG